MPNSLKFLQTLLELTLRIFYKHQTFSRRFSMDSNLKTLSQKKELLYAKVVIRGKTVELLRKYIHMDDYGSDAADLKHTFDDTMKNAYKSLLIVLSS